MCISGLDESHSAELGEEALNGALLPVSLVDYRATNNNYFSY